MLHCPPTPFCADLWVVLGAVFLSFLLQQSWISLSRTHQSLSRTHQSLHSVLLFYLFLQFKTVLTPRLCECDENKGRGRFLHDTTRVCNWLQLSEIGSRAWFERIPEVMSHLIYGSEGLFPKQQLKQFENFTKNMDLKPVHVTFWHLPQVFNCYIDIIFWWI